jgi:membrane-associated protease RseP (regulator of RpoE activity)
MSEETLTPAAEGDDAHAQPLSTRALVISVALFFATLVSTTFVGMLTNGDSLSNGLRYSVPLMSILLSHELGHYIAARIHGVPSTPPFFVPMPLPPLGTMGAVIVMRDRITSRNALLDIGAAGPLAGMVIALPVLIYGIATSPVSALPVDGGYQLEGRSLLYLGLLHLLKGPIPEGYDVMLSPTAFAGWAGLLVTMLNLIPAAQLDGGHVAYALFGERQENFSRRVRAALLPIAVVVALYYGLPELTAHARFTGFAPGLQWLVWWFLLSVITRRSEREHPATDDEVLSPGRRAVAWCTLALFVVLFMPAWMREVPARAQPAAQPTAQRVS